MEFAEFCHVQYCIGVANGLDALTPILRAAGIGRGDEVLVPGHTFIGTWMAVSAAGAFPVGVGVDPQTLKHRLRGGRSKNGIISNHKHV